jgi:hypothetical protein
MTEAYRQPKIDHSIDLNNSKIELLRNFGVGILIFGPIVSVLTHSHYSYKSTGVLFYYR